MRIAGVAQWQSSGIVNHRQKFDSSHQLKINQFQILLDVVSVIDQQYLIFPCF